MNRAVLVSLATLALAALLGTSSPLAADLIAGTHYTGFVDVNGNGRLDCGEPVTIEAAWSTNDFQTTGLSGTLAAPGTGAQGLIFLPGSVEIVPDLSVGCTETIVAGNVPEDGGAQVQFTCDPQIPNPKGQTLFVVQYRALYFNSSFPGFVSAATVTTPDAGTFTKTEAQSVPGPACSGSPNTLQIAKTESGTAAPGATIVYQLTVTDTGAFGAGGLQLVEVVPDHTTFAAAASSPGWFCSPDAHAGSVCRNPVGNLLAGASLSRLFAVTIDSPLPAGVQSLNNTGCVREGPDQVDGCASVMTPTAGVPRLTVSKSLASGTAAPGATLVYTISAQNTGNEGATNVTFTEAVPANTTFAAGASSPGWACTPDGNAGSTCTISVATLEAGASSSRSFAVLVADPLPANTTEVANTACAKSPDAQDSCHDVTVPTSGMPALNLTKTLVSGTGVPGDTLVYDLALQNTGNQDAASAALAETVPQGTTFAGGAGGASAPGWACLPDGGAGSSCSFALGALAAGSTVHTRFAVTILSPLPAGITAILNTACAAAPGAATSCATLPVTPKASPILSVEKTYSGGPVHPGDDIAFTITVRNTGNQDSTPVTLTDAVPAHTTFRAAGGTPGWVCDPDGRPPSVCTLDAGNIPAGGSFTATIGFRRRRPASRGRLPDRQLRLCRELPRGGQGRPRRSPAHGLRLRRDDDARGGDRRLAARRQPPRRHEPERRGRCRRHDRLPASSSPTPPR